MPVWAQRAVILGVSVVLAILVEQFLKGSELYKPLLYACGLLGGSVFKGNNQIDRTDVEDVARATVKSVYPPGPAENPRDEE